MKKIEQVLKLILIKISYKTSLFLVKSRQKKNINLTNKHPKRLLKYVSTVTYIDGYNYYLFTLQQMYKLINTIQWSKI